ncbi:hypothetical protein [Sulfurospirillum barnesii]|uniref:Uncharacterized protein n=1 Tax=Sulfurospirillum barnesii (strain ATCC 700032 / DSM 10660 / SES-3) TaxID=760154 RepID=I3XWV0_SULBS|nr:hypothetical protein [Sulfurospirillum barnesii]AFL68424.1 hypothetical protein Sulba_1128 [Sulfurospirillum barnesii SES-3]
MQNVRFEKFLSFLQGASLAFAIAGGMYMFLAFLPFGFLTAFIVGLLFFLVGSFFFIVFEMAHLQIDKVNELKKQTHLLEKFSLNDQKLSHH